MHLPDALAQAAELSQHQYCRYSMLVY
jgi:hypothetical protein